MSLAVSSSCDSSGRAASDLLTAPKANPPTKAAMKMFASISVATRNSANGISMIVMGAAPFDASLRR